MQTNEQAIQAFEQAGSAQQIIDAFLAYLEGYECIGFNAADFDQSDPSRLILYTSHPDVFGHLDEESDWWADDPVLARLNLGEMRPFDVEATWAEALPSAGYRWQAIRAAGLHRGVVFPTSKAGFVGAVHVICRDDDAVRATLNDHLSAMHAISTYMHAFMTELRPRAQRAEGVVRNTLQPYASKGMKALLTPREVGCLRWLAHGKTAEDIAVIESLSPHTVRDYIKSAMAKLEARTQAQAVARALKYNLFRI